MNYIAVSTQTLAHGDLVNRLIANATMPDIGAELRLQGLEPVEVIGNTATKRHHHLVSTATQSEGRWSLSYTYVPFSAGEVAEAVGLERKQAKQAIEALQAQLLEGFPFDFGEPYGQLHLQCRDTDDKANWSLVRQSAMLALFLEQSEVTHRLRTQENTVVTASSVLTLQALNALLAYGQAVLDNGWALKDQINSSDNPLQIDITQGWP